MKHFLWTEIYRPETVADTILPERLKKPFQEYVNQKQIPHLMLTGSAGVGKTTIALAMCKEIGLSHLLINGSEERGIDTLRVKIKNYASTMAFDGGRKVVIIDEADNMTPDVQKALRAFMEQFSINCTFIFTCNFKARLIEPLHSRCAVIDFKLTGPEKSAMAIAFFKRLEGILTEQSVPFEKPVLAKIVEKFFPDFRRTLNELQKLSTMGAIDAAALSALSDIRELNVLVKALKEKDFKVMRKWVVTNSDVDTSKIYRAIYDSLYDYLQPASIPPAVLTIAKYQYQSAFVADQEINLCACLTEMMVECEFK